MLVSERGVAMGFKVVWEDGDEEDGTAARIGDI